MNTTAETIAAALGRYSRNGNGFMAQCPAHDDRNPSLSISESNDGKILVHCKAGCSQDKVVVALKDRDLWPVSTPSTRPPNVKQEVTGTYEYHDKDGNVFHTKERLEPGKKGKKKDFQFWHLDRDGAKKFSRRNGQQILYNLPEVLKAKSVIITEGEKHADLLKSWEMPATTLDSGASSKPTPEMMELLTGKRVTILRDNDGPGLAYAATLANALHGKAQSVKVVLLPGLPEKGDICDWVQEPGNDKARLLQIIEATEEWEPSAEGIEDASSADVWPAPILFGEIETPEILHTALPEPLAAFCKAVTDFAQTPPGMAVMMALAVIATCLQKRVEVCPFGDSYTEPVNLMILVSLEPGGRKSAVVKAMTAPLTEWEVEQSEALKEQVVSIRHEREMIIKSIDSIKIQRLQGGNNGRGAPGGTG